MLKATGPVWHKLCSEDFGRSGLLPKEKRRPSLILRHRRDSGDGDLLDATRLEVV